MCQPSVAFIPTARHRPGVRCETSLNPQRGTRWAACALNNRRYGKIRIKSKPAGFYPTGIYSSLALVSHIFSLILMENVVEANPANSCLTAVAGGDPTKIRIIALFWHPHFPRLGRSGQTCLETRLYWFSFCLRHECKCSSFQCSTHSEVYGCNLRDWDEGPDFADTFEEAWKTAVDYFWGAPLPRFCTMGGSQYMLRSVCRPLVVCCDKSRPLFQALGNVYY